MDDGFRARREMRNTTTIWSKWHLKLCHMYRNWDRPGSEVFFFPMLPTTFGETLAGTESGSLPSKDLQFRPWFIVRQQFEQCSSGYLYAGSRAKTEGR